MEGSPESSLLMSSLLQVVGTRWDGHCFWCQPGRMPGRHHGVLPQRLRSCSPTYAVSLGKGTLSHLDRLHLTLPLGVMERPQVPPSTVRSKSQPQARCGDGRWAFPRLV